jgi:uncharacterized membrane protein
MPQTTMTIPRTHQGVRDLDQVRGRLIPVSGGPAPLAGSGRNMGSADRVACTVGGGALLLLGLAHGSLPGLGLAALGGSLLYSGISGHCPLYAALGWNTAGDTGPDAEIVYRPR